MENRLSNGNVFKVVIRLAIPAMLAQFINVLYSIIDRIYISRLPNIGDFALAGIGIAAPVCTLITSFSLLIGLGGAPLMGICIGEGSRDKARRLLINSFYALLVLGLIVPTVILALHNPLLHFFGGTENTYSYARDYLLIYLIGAPFAILSLGLNQFLISQGYSSKAMITMVLGAVINIVLDPLFIFTFDMGVMGAALATATAQLASFLYVFIVLVKFSNIKLRLDKLDYRLILKIMRVGFSPFIISMTDSLICIVLNVSIKLYAGDLVDSYIAASTITSSVYQLFSMPLLGISGGTGSILSYNYGARNKTRVIKASHAIVITAVVFTTISFVICSIFKRDLVSFFTKDVAVIDIADKALFIFMSTFILLSFQYCYVDGLTALGMAKYAITLSLVRKISMIFFTLTIPLFGNVMGVFYSQMISDIISSVTTFFVFTFSINKILERRSKEGSVV